MAGAGIPRVGGMYAGGGGEESGVGGWGWGGEYGVADFEGEWE